MRRVAILLSALLALGLGSAALHAQPTPGPTRQPRGLPGTPRLDPDLPEAPGPDDGPIDPTARPSPGLPTRFRFSPGDLERRARVYARFGDEAVTVGDIEDAISRQAPGMRSRYESQDRLRELAEGLVRARLLAREAARRGYARNEVVQRQIAQALVERLMVEELDFAPRDIPADEVESYYEAHSEEFQRPEMVQALHIRLPSAEAARQILAEAQRTDLRGFRALAREHSIDTETKLSGGDLGFFTQRGLPIGADEDDEPVHAALVAAAFALQNPGDITREPVEAAGGYSIVMLRARRPARRFTLPQAEPEIRQRLWRTKRQEQLDALVEALRTRFHPEVFPDTLEPMEIPPGEALPGLSAPHAASPEPAPAMAEEPTSPTME